MSKTILFIHQSSELYGSDKSLYYLVKGINSNTVFNAIVVLPNDGPLKKLLENNNIRVVIFSVIKVSRSIFNPLSLISLPLVILKRTAELKKILKYDKIDIVHSNTLAVLLGAFYAKRYSIKHIWHVHEIIKKPKIVSIIYPFLVKHLSHKAVFNSEASRDFLCNNSKSLYHKAVVNLNGMDRDASETSDIKKAKIRNDLFGAKNTDIVIALVGRISKWKGQQLLLEAFTNLNTKYDNLKLVFVGSAPPNQEHLVDELVSKIKELDSKNSCKIIPFQENIWSIWDSIDLALVPSTEPEPFGLVALEAMLAKKPVIAANHGGLREIIKDGETGYFFEPNNSIDLKNTIEKLIRNKKNLISFGFNGYQKAKNDFSLKRHILKFVEIYQNI